ncbi:MAG: transporter substrate-binding domain-containing protein, partial [Victivallaceae bacterium]|nr:transporter substrate-binding domain-containing protein [Victivallaceae bacterium]
MTTKADGRCACGHDHHHHDDGHCTCGQNHHHHDDGHCICGHDHRAEGVAHDRSMGKLFFIAVGGVLTLNSFALETFFPAQNFAAQMSALFGAFILALPIILTAVKDLTHGKVYMNELVALAILAALAGGDFQIAGLIAFFLLLTIIIETRTASGARRSIEELVKLAPETARRIENDGKETVVRATELSVGDKISVRPGENFPVDGKIIAGESTVNQASITGESLPIEQSAGDDVIAGKYDVGVSGITITEQRKKNALFTTPYCLAAQAIVVVDGSTIASKADLDGKKISVQTG